MLKIFNTLGRELQDFKPIEEGKVRFYQCGPTVYWTQHIGNMRAVVAADLIRRTFQYLGYKVKFVRNYTDVGHLVSDGDEGEDKMAKGAKREGLTPDEIADKYIQIFEDDINALNILPADVKPRATHYIKPMIEMVQDLLDKSFAYSTPKAIYFDVTKFPEYTKLSAQKLDLQEQGAGQGSVDDSQNKHHPADFALWFFKTGTHKNALQTWPSPFSSPGVEKGEGFPGWHIECSAMTKAELGDTLDIHMGGIEHIPVHHPNEIAQSEAANGVKFVNYWLHNEHLNVDDGKMSKSDGTGFALSELIEKGFDPLVLRYFFTQAHYRSKQNFTWEALESAQIALNKLRKEVSIKAFAKTTVTSTDIDEELKSQLVEALEEDFNIPKALGIIWTAVKSPNEMTYGTIKEFDDAVLDLKLTGYEPESLEEGQIYDEAIQELIKERNKAREEKNWARSDEIREVLKGKGVEVVDK